VGPFEDSPAPALARPGDEVSASRPSAAARPRSTVAGDQGGLAGSAADLRVPARGRL